MLSYQHGYHAGSFADVVKHLTLSRLLHYMLSKEKPIFYFETHSGSGVYDLFCRKALKTKEYHEGISILWKVKDKLPSVFAPYLECITQINDADELRFYPGSPDIAIKMLRQQDRLYFCELHPREYEQLKQLPRQGKRVHYSPDDGLLSLNALIPPPERRGLIFIDPSFELKTDYKEIPKLLHSAYQRFSTGVFCLWYPLVDNQLNEQLNRGMNQIASPNKLQIEFCLTREMKRGMTGCGLWIINPPYVLAKEMNSALKYLSTLFHPLECSYRVDAF